MTNALDDYKLEYEYSESEPGHERLIISKTLKRLMVWATFTLRKEKD